MGAAFARSATALRSRGRDGAHGPEPDSRCPCSAVLWPPSEARTVRGDGRTAPIDRITPAAVDVGSVVFDRARRGRDIPDDEVAAASLDRVRVGVFLAVPATTMAAPPSRDCGLRARPHWTAPGRSGRDWYVVASGVSCVYAFYVVETMGTERIDRQGRFLGKVPHGFIGCAADTRHRNIHPYGTAACVGDRVAVSWGIKV